jgi:hypothetical protein
MIAIILLYGFSFQLFSQNVQILTGKIIGYDICGERVHPVEDAFDNNLNTYFMSCPTFGNWIGLDLKEKYIIAKIVYSPRMDSDYGDRLQLGVFEGANSPDFGDAIPLFMIQGTTGQQLTEQIIHCSKGFRYVRFVFPYAQTEDGSSYMSELKFYGYKGEGDNSKLPQVTNLPTVSIHTVDVQDITSKEEYVKGIISIISNDGTKLFTDSTEIRGRGNSSWSFPKKPYRIKLYNKAQLLSLPANAKSWTLINNYGDKTLMRNMLAFDFSRRLEMPYTSPAEPVDVFLNGDYKGCYQLSDQIEVRENRVDVEEMKKSDVSGANLTGGYLIEIDAYYESEPKTFISRNYSMPVTIKSPDSDDIVSEQENYIADYFNKFVDAVFADNYTDPQNGFRKYMDVETFLRHFLVGEYSGNTDTYWSVYMSKKRNEDKFTFGPVWDFDLAFENDDRTYPVNDKTDWMYRSGGNCAGATRDFVDRIMSDHEMFNRLKEIYFTYRDSDIISAEVLLKVVDDYALLLEQSQQLNFKRWPILDQQVHQNPEIYYTYEAEVNNVKNYIEKRIEWLDRRLTNDDGTDKPEIIDITVSTSANRLHLSNVTKPVTVRIVDMAGRTVDTRNISDNTTINLTKGAYLIVVTDKTTSRTYKCIVP